MQSSPAPACATTRDIHQCVADALTQIENEAGKNKYTWLPDSIIKHVVGSPDEARILRAVLSNLLNNFTLERAPLSIPGSICNLYERELDRIKLVVDAGNQSSLRFSLDVRQKDIAILTFRLIPVGAEFAEPWSSIWKEKVLISRASQFFKSANFFILKKNGFWPYLQLHMHQESHMDFHQEGWTRTYMRLAELLENNPGHRGWFSSSWLIDPALEHISPHLSYLRTVPENNGGAIFYIEDDPMGKTGALLTSKTRRRQFELGLYRPRIYLRVWPRSSSIAWWKARVNEIEYLS